MKPHEASTKECFNQAHDSLVQLTRTFWGQAGLCAVCGILTALAHPPFGVIGGIMAYGLWLWGLGRDLGPHPLRRAFILSWIAGFFYFLIGCFWVAEAFLVDAGTYGWMAPFAVCLLPLIAGFFWGLSGWVYRALRLTGLWRGIGFSVIFSTFEIARGTLFTGFPWNPAGASWKAGSLMSQTASLIGVYGLGLVTIAMVATLFSIDWKAGRKVWARPAFAVGLVFAVMIGWGAYRVATNPINPSAIKVRLVQPGIGQKAKWSRDGFRHLFTAYTDMSRAPVTDGHPPDLIVWSEGALPAGAEDLFSVQSWTSTVFQGLLKPNQTLIFGAYREDRNEQGGSEWKNSMIAVTGQGEQTRAKPIYDKYKLVPFGEFLPFEDLMGRLGIKSLVHFGDGFTAGAPTRPISLDHIGGFIPLICYEGLFSGLSQSSPGDPEPQMIINISNDAWFGVTSGPVQHLNLSSYRAIEEGLPLVRVTPTGISVITDALGRELRDSRLEMLAAGYKDIYIPKRIKSKVVKSNLKMNLVFILFSFLLISLKGTIYRQAAALGPEKT